MLRSLIETALLSELSYSIALSHLTLIEKKLAKTLKLMKINLYIVIESYRRVFILSEDLERSSPTQKETLSPIKTEEIFQEFLNSFAEVYSSGGVD